MKSVRFMCSTGAVAAALVMGGCSDNKVVEKAADPGPASDAVAAAVAAVDVAAPAEFTSPVPTPKPIDPDAPVVEKTTLPDGTSYVDEVVGTGEEAVKGCKASVYYTGKLQNGTQFDSNAGSGNPFTVEPLGEAGVITGWNTGLVGMKVGGKRTLTIPYQSAYGEQGMPPRIPARATLVFDVELVGVSK